MIRVFDASKLALTKLKTRKIRLFVTVVISCLLFSVLATSSLIFRGVTHGVEEFNQEGFGSRYIISGSPTAGDPNKIMGNKDLIAKAKTLQADLVVRKKAEAKRLGIEYESTTEQLPYSEIDGPDGKQQILIPENPIAKKAIAEYLSANPQPGLPEFKKLAASYEPKAFYESQALSQGQSGGVLKVLKGDKEEFLEELQMNNFGPPRGTDSFASSWTLMSGELLEPFIIGGASKEVGADGVLPVVAPYTAVEQLLSLDPLPAKVDARTQLARLKEVREKSSSLKFSVCYRNESANDLINQAMQQKREIDQNKTNKDYKKPSLIYGLPTESCGTAVVLSDTRNADEKKLAAKQDEFDRIFGKVAPATKAYNFRVIGIVPDPPDFAAQGVAEIFGSILTSSVGTGWFTPSEARSASPLIQTVFSEQKSIGGFGQPSDLYYVELPSADLATSFIKQQNCNPDFQGPPAAGQSTDPFEICAKEGKSFGLVPFGSSSLALVEIKKGFNKFFRIAAIVVAIIAGIIMMGAVGRIIADSRRETAVFRAIGAKRLDIAQIYIIYTLLLSTLIVAGALVIGFTISQLAEARYSESFSIKALIAYNAQDLTKEIHMYGLEVRDLLRLALFTYAAGLISAIFPLLSNVRRNPIRDMRDEN